MQRVEDTALIRPRRAYRAALAEAIASCVLGRWAWQRSCRLRCLPLGKKHLQDSACRERRASPLSNRHSLLTPLGVAAFHFLPDSCILLGLCWIWDMCGSIW